VIAPNLFRSERLSAGRAYLMGSELVYARNDGMLPMIVQDTNDAVTKPYTLIGNGIGSDNNLSNTKGQNKFSGENLIIKVSHPNVDVLRQYADLEFAGVEQHHIALGLIIDDLHQAIGRSGGNRYKDGTHMICLVPVRYVEAIEAISRYGFASTEVLSDDSIHIFNPSKQNNIIAFIKAVQNSEYKVYTKGYELKIKLFGESIQNMDRRKQFYNRVIHFYTKRIERMYELIDEIKNDENCTTTNKNKSIAVLEKRQKQCVKNTKLIEKMIF